MEGRVGAALLEGDPLRGRIRRAGGVGVEDPVGAPVDDDHVRVAVKAQERASSCARATMLRRYSIWVWLVTWLDTRRLKSPSLSDHRVLLSSVIGTPCVPVYAVKTS